MTVHEDDRPNLVAIGVGAVILNGGLEVHAGFCYYVSIAVLMGILYYAINGQMVC